MVSLYGIVVIHGENIQKLSSQNLISLNVTGIDIANQYESRGFLEAVHTYPTSTRT